MADSTSPQTTQVLECVECCRQWQVPEERWRIYLTDDDPPEADVILAGDCWYEARFAERVLPWLRRARGAGIDVLVGDPGRRYLPSAELEELAAYEVRTTTELEDLDLKRGRVFRLRA